MSTDDIDRKAFSIVTKWTAITLLLFLIFGIPIHEIAHIVQMKMGGYGIQEYCLYGDKPAGGTGPPQADAGWVYPSPEAQIPYQGRLAMEAQAYLAQLAFIITLLMLFGYKTKKEIGGLMGKEAGA